MECALGIDIERYIYRTILKRYSTIVKIRQISFDVGNSIKKCTSIEALVLVILSVINDTTDKAFDRYLRPQNDAIALPDFSSGRADPRGDTTRHESGFRRRRQSRRAGYKSDYRNIANVIFLASGCEPSRIGDSVYWLLLGSSWMKDGAVRPVDMPPSRIASAKSPSRPWRILQNRLNQLKINYAIWKSICETRKDSTIRNQTNIFAIKHSKLSCNTECLHLLVLLFIPWYIWYDRI